MSNPYIFDKLPQPLAHRLYKSFYSKSYNNFVEKGNNPISKEAYSLKQFHNTDSIFVRIPKCGTQSLSIALFGNYGFGHTSMREYRLILPPEDFDKMWKFALMRNPYERLLSAFYFLKKGGVSRKDEKFARRFLRGCDDLKEFLNGPFKDPKVRGFLHFLPQSTYILVNNKLVVDSLFRLEEIDKHFPSIAKRVNPNAVLEHKNKTLDKRQNDLEIFKEEKSLLKRVNRFYHQDFVIGGYEIKDVW